MPLKPCKECGKEISTEAKVCPNCGKKDPTAAAGVPRWVVILGGLFVLFLLVDLTTRGSSPPENMGPRTAADSNAVRSAAAASRARDSIAQQQELAEQICRDAAMKSLKAPSTASFADDETYFKDLGRSKSHVQLQVDAENSFGAKLRTTIDCKTAQTGGSVRLTSIDSWSR